MAQVAKVLPHNIEAEQSILGSMLLSEKCVYEAIEKLSPEDFYVERHKKVYLVMQDLANVGLPVDLITIIDRLEQQNPLSIEEKKYLTDLTDIVPSTSNLGYYIDIVREKSILRRLIGICHDSTDQAFSASLPVDEIINTTSEKIYNLVMKDSKSTLEHIKPALIESYIKIGEAAKSKEGIMGISTGFPIMDKMLSGLQASQLIIIAGRPGMGKTSFALNIVEHVAVKNTLPVVIFSLEMSSDQLATRILCSQANVDSQSARTGQLKDSDFQKLSDTMEELAQKPIYIDDNATIGVGEMLGKARRLSQQLGQLGLIVIDYLQLMSGSTNHGENRQQEISGITRALKVMARDLNVPIVLLSQLSRATEKRENKRPMLSDLRESGSIEQDADVVLFLHREDYYGENEGEAKSQIIIAKQRSGPTGAINVQWQGEFTRYRELDFVHDEPAY